MNGEATEGMARVVEKFPHADYAGTSNVPIYRIAGSDRWTPRTWRTG